MEKLFVGPVYYFGYPLIFHHYGPVRGFMIVTLILLLVSLVFMVFYDRGRRDFLHVNFAVRSANEFVNNITRKLFTRDYRGGSAKILVFAVIVWQFFPPYAVLSRRKEGEWGFSRKEFFMLIAVVIILNTFWTMVAYAEILSFSKLVSLIRNLF